MEILNKYLGIIFKKPNDKTENEKLKNNSVFSFEYEKHLEL